MNWVIIVLLVVVVLVVLWGVSAYNSLVKLRNTIQQAWGQIDVELNRRYDLIPNLVETVRGYAAHERNLLESVTALRSQAASLAQASGGQFTPERAQAEEQLSGAVRNLIVSVEAYPDLKSNQNFLALQQELTATEDRIANGRRYFNAVVGDYNTKVESFPTNLFANMGGFQKTVYFQANDSARTAPNVNFGEISQRPVPAEPSNQDLYAQQQAAIPPFVPQQPSVAYPQVGQAPGYPVAQPYQQAPGQQAQPQPYQSAPAVQPSPQAPSQQPYQPTGGQPYPQAPGQPYAQPQTPYAQPPATTQPSAPTQPPYPQAPGQPPYPQQVPPTQS